MQECSNPQQYEVISGEKLSYNSHGSYKFGRQGCRLASDGGLQPTEVGGKKMRIHWHCQGWGVRAFPCHLSRRWFCPCVIHGDKDGLDNNRNISSGKVICSYLRQNWNVSQEGTAFLTYLITAQGCASGSFVSLTTGGLVQKSVTKLQLSELSKSQLPPLDAQSHCSIALPWPRGHTNTGHR